MEEEEEEEKGSAAVTRKTAFGGSLPVANVQALAATLHHGDNVPHRYIRPEAEAVSSSGSGGGRNDYDEIPIIDVGKLLGSEDEEEAAKLKLACEDWGFFQIINHGVPEEVVERMKADVREFFSSATGHS